MSRQVRGLAHKMFQYQYSLKTNFLNQDPPQLVSAVSSIHIGVQVVDLVFLETGEMSGHVGGLNHKPIQHLYHSKAKFSFRKSSLTCVCNIL